MAGREISFYAVLKRRNVIKNLKIRCDCKNEIEVGGTLKVDEIGMAEGDILRIAGNFGTIDLGISMSELRDITEKEVAKGE